VVLPVPEGAATTKGIPTRDTSDMAPSGATGLKPGSNRLRVDRGEDHVITVSDQNRSGLPPLGGIDQLTGLARLLAQAAHGR